MVRGAIMSRVSASTFFFNSSNRARSPTSAAAMSRRSFWESGPRASTSAASAASAYPSATAISRSARVTSRNRTFCGHLAVQEKHCTQRQITGEDSTSRRIPSSTCRMMRRGSNSASTAETGQPAVHVPQAKHIFTFSPPACEATSCLNLGSRSGSLRSAWLPPMRNAECRVKNEEWE